MSLTNKDLEPTPEAKRTWNLWHFAALWVGMAVCIPTYTLASGLIDQGMSWKEAIACIALGNMIVLIPMILNAHAGTKYGIPFPVFARASFGVLGANVAAILRALVACGWFGIQTWIGGQALWQLLISTFPGAEAPLSSLAMKEFIGIHPGQLVCFSLFWVINLYFILKGTEAIKFLESWAAPFLILMGLALLFWAYRRAGGFGTILAQPSKLEGRFLEVFGPGLTAMVGFWATLSLNIPDFTRYAKSQRDQAIGQAIGLPGTMILFAFIGVAVTSATPVIFNGEVIWDPIILLGRIGGSIIMVISMAGLSVATLSTNLAANVVSPANDFSNISPARISYKMGGIITAVIGAIILPWKLIESSKGYIFTWLVGYSALLGPIGGIMITDYFLLRDKKLVVDDLYKRGGIYEYDKGINWRAMIAMAIGVAINLPGFIAEAVPGMKDSVPGALRTIYTYAWFVGFLVAGGIYYVLSTGNVKVESKAKSEPKSEAE